MSDGNRATSEQVLALHDAYWKGGLKHAHVERFEKCPYDVCRRLRKAFPELLDHRIQGDRRAS